MPFGSAAGQVDGGTPETRTYRALPYVLVGHPNDMENILVNMIVNTNKSHSYPFVSFGYSDIFNHFSLSGKSVIADLARVAVTQAKIERTRTPDEFGERHSCARALTADMQTYRPRGGVRKLLATLTSP